MCTTGRLDRKLAARRQEARNPLFRRCSATQRWAQTRSANLHGRSHLPHTQSLVRAIMTCFLVQDCNIASYRVWLPPPAQYCFLLHTLFAWAFSTKLPAHSAPLGIRSIYKLKIGQSPVRKTWRTAGPKSCPCFAVEKRDSIGYVILKTSLSMHPDR
jgi:hypothetical protein